MFLNLVKKALKQKRGTTIETQFAPPYSFLYIVELDEEVLQKSEFKRYLWWRYIDDIFPFGSVEKKN